MLLPGVADGSLSDVAGGLLAGVKVLLLADDGGLLAGVRDLLLADDGGSLFGGVAGGSLVDVDVDADVDVDPVLDSAALQCCSGVITTAASFWNGGRVKLTKSISVCLRKTRLRLLWD